jgi:hypothetical protein
MYLSGKKRQKVVNSVTTFAICLPQPALVWTVGPFSCLARLASQDRPARGPFIGLRDVTRGIRTQFR